MIAMTNLAVGLLACCMTVVVAETKYVLRERNELKVAHATVPNMHKWSAAKHNLRMNRQLDIMNTDDYNILSHAVHEICGKNGKSGGKSGGKNGGKSGTKGYRRNLNPIAAKGGCNYDTDDVSEFSDDDDEFREGYPDDDGGIPPSPSFVPITGDDPIIAPPTVQPNATPTSAPTTKPSDKPTPAPVVETVDDDGSSVPTQTPAEQINPAEDTHSPTVAPSAPEENDDASYPSPTVSNDDVADDDIENVSLDDDQESPSNNSVDVGDDDEGNDDDGGDNDDEGDGAPGEDEYESISNEGTNRQGTGGGFLPIDDTPTELPEEPYVPTNEDFYVPTNQD